MATPVQPRLPGLVEPTLQELLARYGIHRPCDLAKVLECSKQMAHMYWHGRDSQGFVRPIGYDVALILHDRLGVPIDAVMHAKPDGRPVPRLPRGTRWVSRIRYRPGPKTPLERRTTKGRRRKRALGPRAAL